MTTIKPDFHFLWLSNAVKPDAEFIVPKVLHLKTLVAWMAHANSVTLWYDSATVTDKQVQATRDWLVAHDVKDTCTIKDARSHFKVYAGIDTWSRKLETVPTMFKVDVLKVLIQRWALKRGVPGSVAIVADIDIPPQDPMLNPFVIQRLRQFGVLYANKRATEEIENGWCVAAAGQDLKPATADLCDKALNITVFLSMLRLKHSKYAGNVSGCVYESLKQALTWLMAHLFPEDLVLVRVLEQQETGLVVEEYDPFALDSTYWSKNTAPDMKTLAPLVISDEAESEGAFQGAEQHWQLIYQRPVTAVRQRDEQDPRKLHMDHILIPCLALYFETGFDKIPMHFIDIGETKGEENWLSADA